MTTAPKNKGQKSKCPIFFPSKSCQFFQQVPKLLFFVFFTGFGGGALPGEKTLESTTEIGVEVLGKPGFQAKILSFTILSY